MEATFKIQANEFDLGLFEKIQQWVKSNGNSEIIISIRDETSDSSITGFGSLNKSIQELAEGNSKTFTMEELKSYLDDNFLL